MPKPLNGSEVRDQLLPLYAFLIVLLAVWLGIAGPLPVAFADWLHRWQTLAAAIVAIAAAYIAFTNTRKTILHTERLEQRRRSRKLASIRAIMPIALSQISNYAEQSADALNTILEKSVDEAIPHLSVPKDLVLSFPTETLKMLAEFIEYSDVHDVSVIESTVAMIQVHMSRTRSLVEGNHDPSENYVVTRTEVENCIIDAASIYAGAASLFDYARRRTDSVPLTLSWDDVKASLQNLGLFEEENDTLYQSVARHESVSEGPFRKLKPAARRATTAA